MKCRPVILGRQGQAGAAFTLIEVAVASAIMALALFGFISVCSTALKSAKSLNRVEVDASSLAAELSISNRLEEMSDHGDFGKLYPGYQWSRSVYEVGTNGLFRALNSTSFGFFGRNYYLSRSTGLSVRCLRD